VLIGNVQIAARNSNQLISGNEFKDLEDKLKKSYCGDNLFQATKLPKFLFLPVLFSCHNQVVNVAVKKQFLESLDPENRSVLEWLTYDLNAIR